MKPIVTHFRGERLSLRLGLGDLAEVAGVERDFLKIVNQFRRGEEMDWPVVEAILGGALRGREGLMKRLVEERGALEAHALAGRLFIGAMFAEDEEDAGGNAEAGAGTKTGDSPSPPSSAPAP